MIRLCLWLLLISPWQWAIAGDVYVRIKSEVTLDHLNVYLGDVATVTADTTDRQMPERLLREPVAHLATLAIPTRIGKQEIEQSLLKRKLDGREDFVFGGPDFIVVYGKRQTISLMPQLDYMANWLAERLSIQLEVVNLTLMTNNVKLTDVPMGKVEQRALFEQIRLSGNDIRIPLSVSVDGHIYAKPIIQFRLDTKHARSDSERPARLTQSVNNAVVRPVVQSQAVADVYAASQISLVKKNFLIKKGQHVRIVVQEGSIQIESEGVAMMDADVGDMVKVRRIDGKDMLIGRVLGSDTVVIGNDADA